MEISNYIVYNSLMNKSWTTDYKAKWISVS